MFLFFIADQRKGKNIEITTKAVTLEITHTESVSEHVGARTSEYPDGRLLPFFENPLCNQKFAFQNYISLKQNRVKPIHTKFEINWRLRVHYMNYSICFTHCSKMAEIGRTWTYYIA
jgi:hypothetical protein